MRPSTPLPPAAGGSSSTSRQRPAIRAGGLASRGGGHRRGLASRGGGHRLASPVRRPARSPGRFPSTARQHGHRAPAAPAGAAGWGAAGRPATPMDGPHRGAGQRPSSGTAPLAGPPDRQRCCPAVPRCPRQCRRAPGSTRTPTALRAPHGPLPGYQASSGHWQPDRLAAAPQPAAALPAPPRSAAAGSAPAPCRAASGRGFPRPFLTQRSKSRWIAGTDAGETAAVVAASPPRAIRRIRRHARTHSTQRRSRRSRTRPAHGHGRELRRTNWATGDGADDGDQHCAGDGEEVQAEGLCVGCYAGDRT